MMDDQVVFERKKRGLTADRKKIEKEKKMGNRKMTGRKRRRMFSTCLFRHPDYSFRTPLTGGTGSVVSCAAEVCELFPTITGWYYRGVLGGI